MSENWVQRLRDHCAVQRLGNPAWQDVSDRRGGRTAWSSVVIVNGNQYLARYWYDGDFLESARKDAAEVALNALTGTGNTVAEPSAASFYPRA
ncbi:hypothetical protein K505DRAFT_358539 [Melanomma pulvis-pyrius CBS 109.77]|uniref:DRBM domain-containing protein n=1 Tax=Melanomma pulvis-pyrius CBS 109.77 TaxID=1314802 RepID=A0A6A6XLX2_9PLEO|nr:hypothetical protein K505DRAFT_358539 [Melanomma pulvis-pyrius CBS 109.77]